jgi:hypothetical protein
VDTCHKLIDIIEDYEFLHGFLSYQLTSEGDHLPSIEEVKNSIERQRESLKNVKKHIDILESFFNGIGDLSSPPQYNPSGTYIALVREGKISSQLVDPINWLTNLILKKDESDISTNIKESGDVEQISQFINLILSPEERISKLDEIIFDDTLQHLESYSKVISKVVLDYSQNQLEILASATSIYIRARLNDQAAEQVRKKYLFCSEIDMLYQFRGKIQDLNKEVENIELSLVGTKTSEKAVSVANYFEKNYRLIRKHIKIVEVATGGMCSPINGIRPALKIED